MKFQITLIIKITIIVVFIRTCHETVFFGNKTIEKENF